MILNSDNCHYRFTVFTATYNRGTKILNVYEDLLNQTFKNFEWVIVNDGSRDETDQIVKSIIAEGKLDIQYINKSNGGKHTAWRAATEIFKGRYIVTADDDDRISPDILEVFDKHWTTLENDNNYSLFWEIKARCMREDGRIVGSELPKPWFDSDYNSIKYKYKLGGAEMVGCRKREVLQQEASVPEHFIYDDKVSNFPEGIRWSRAARKYKTRFISEIVRTYYYTEDSLSHGNKKNKDNQISIKHRYNLLIDKYYSILEQRDLMLRYSWKTYIKDLILLCFCRQCTKGNISLTEFKTIDKYIYNILQVLVYPIYLYKR